MSENEKNKYLFLAICALVIAVFPSFCDRRLCRQINVPDLPSEGGFSYDFYNVSRPVAISSISGTATADPEGGVGIYGIELSSWE